MPSYKTQPIITKNLLHHRLMGRVPKPLDYVNFRYETQPSQLNSVEEQYREHLFTCEFFVTRIGPVGMKETFAKQAAAMLCNELYGDIRAELRELTHLVYKNLGPEHDQLIDRLKRIIEMTEPSND